MRFSVCVVWPSVLSLNNLKVLKTQNKNICIRWMLSFSSILNGSELTKVQLGPYTTVKLILQYFKSLSFRRSTASSGIEKNVPRKVHKQNRTRSERL